MRCRRRQPLPSFLEAPVPPDGGFFACLRVRGHLERGTDCGFVPDFLAAPPRLDDSSGTRGSERISPFRNTKPAQKTASYRYYLAIRLRDDWHGGCKTGFPKELFDDERDTHPDHAACARRRSAPEGRSREGTGGKNVRESLRDAEPQAIACGPLGRKGFFPHSRRADRRTRGGDLPGSAGDRPWTGAGGTVRAGAEREFGDGVRSGERGKRISGGSFPVPRAAHPSCRNRSRGAAGSSRG